MECDGFAVTDTRTTEKQKLCQRVQRKREEETGKGVRMEGGRGEGGMERQIVRGRERKGRGIILLS